MVSVAEWKKKEVAQVRAMLNDADIIGVVGIHGIAAPQMQQIRANLRDSAKLRVVKIRLLKLALGESKLKNVGQLEQFVEGQVAIITCNENPFKLYQILEKTKTKAPAKGGDIAPMDIKVEKGETPFKPGPVIAELQRAGFPASIDKGKVIFRKSQTIVKEGESIPEGVAILLTKMEIYPMEAGLMLKGVYDDGEIILPSVLDIDLGGFVSDIHSAVANAFGLAMTLAYVTDSTIVPLLQKAHRDSLTLAISQGIVSPTTVSPILSKAYGNMLAVASRISPEAMGEDLRNALAGQSSAAASSVQPPAVTEEEEEDKEEEEEVSEEEAVSGLGALFG